MEFERDIVVVGGGAAGFFAAITAAEKNPDLKITILEKGPEVLGKVRISGGGRCNVTHACWEPKELVKNYPRGGKEMRGPFHTFACGDTVAWFEDRGVPLKIEPDGRMFPITDQSSSIVNTLITAASNAGVEILRRHRVDGILPPNPGRPVWEAWVPGKGSFRAPKLMIATGGAPAVWDLLAGLGHQMVEPVPSLFTFNIEDPLLRGLAGLAVDPAQLKVLGTKLKDEGPTLITHWGLSGPAILRLSAWGARELAEKDYEFDLQVNWTGGQNRERVLEELQTVAEEFPKREPVANPMFGIPSRLWNRLCVAADMATGKKWAETSKKTMQKLAGNLTECMLRVSGKSTFKDEFVTAGGVSLKEIDFKKFESKVVPGLFLAGEVLDIDAVTGGFNFQAAWTGGYLAGLGMVEE